MLANGIKLAFSETKGDYQNLVGLKEVPEFGIEPEKVENTTLKNMNLVLVMPGNLSTNSLMITQVKTLLIVSCVRRQTARRNSSSSKPTQMVLRLLLRVKYQLNWVVAE